MTKSYLALPFIALVAACSSQEPVDQTDGSEAATEVASSDDEAVVAEPASEPVAEPARETLIGNWVPISDTCTPPGGMSETAIWISRDSVSGAGWTCTRSPFGDPIGGTDYAYAFNCGYGEGYEGEAVMTFIVGADNVLTWDGHEMASGGEYKKCSQSLSAPY